MKRTVTSTLAALLFAASANAQEGSIEVPVGIGDIVLFQMAVPSARNVGDVPDTRGITEALTGTIVRDFKISGYFNLIDPGAFTAAGRTEGMDPTYKDWFNIGTQGLVKVGYKIVGSKVVVDMRLYAVDAGKRVKLKAPYDKPAELDLSPKKLRWHAHGFVNEVIRYYTKSPGFFQSRIVLVKRVAKGKELYLVSADGRDETRLTKTGGINMLPSLRKGRIYFTSYRNGGPHLFILSKGKSKPFSRYNGLNTGAVLSPDGKHVAVTLSKDGNSEIYLLNPDSGAVVKRLTNSWGIDTSPSWSPDGRQIAFVSDRHGSPQIWLMGVDGSNQRRLTFNGDYNQTPAWSPRGDKIAFTARDERNVFDIFTVGVGSGEIVRLTQNQGNNEEPSWSPNGRFVCFTSTRSGESKLYIMTSDGRVQSQVSTGKGEYLTPFWAS